MRRATIADAESIARINVDAYEASLGDIVDRGVLGRANARRLPMWKALLSEAPPGQAVFVFEQPAVVGFASCGPSREANSDGKGELYSLFVDPTHWNSGVGGELLSAAMNYLRTLDLDAARLWVFDQNQRARQFYDHRGWSELGRVREDERGRFLRYGLSLS